MTLLRRLNTIAVLLLVVGLYASLASTQQAPIGKGTLYVLGIGLTADPSQQTVPMNTGTGVNTHLVFPNINIGGTVITAPADLVVAADLSGPGIANPIKVTAKPGELLILPPLLQKGTYILDHIRLMSGDWTILYAEPSTAFIDTIDKLLMTQVTSRPLSIDEIERLGIVINPDNFTVYNFTVGFATESGIVHVETACDDRYEDEGEHFFRR